MSDPRLLNKDELALFFAYMPNISSSKAHEALAAVRDHIQAQAEQITELEADAKLGRLVIELGRAMALAEEEVND